MSIIWIKARMAAFTLTGVLHIVGLCLISKIKICQCNQRLLIINLAAIEMVGSWYSVLTDAVVIGRKWNMYWEQTHIFFVFTLYTVIRLAVLNIIMDRFLDIFLNLKYPLYITKKFISGVLTAQWITMISAAILFTLLVKFDIYPLHDFYYFLTYFHLSLDILITLVAMVTYTYFFFRVRSIMSTHTQGVSRNKQMLWKNFKVPLLMIASYILFNVTATVMKVVALQRLISRNYHFDELFVLLTGLSGILDTLGWISDGLIYIFLQKKIRGILTSKLGKSIRAQNSVVSEISLSTKT